MSRFEVYFTVVERRIDSVVLDDDAVTTAEQAVQAYLRDRHEVGQMDPRNVEILEDYIESFEVEIDDRKVHEQFCVHCGRRLTVVNSSRVHVRYQDDDGSDTCPPLDGADGPQLHESQRSDQA